MLERAVVSSTSSRRVEFSKIDASKGLAVLLILELGVGVTFDLLLEFWVRNAESASSIAIEHLLEIVTLVFVLIVAKRLYGLTLFEIGFRCEDLKSNLKTAVLAGLVLILMTVFVESTVSRNMPEWLKVPSEYDFVNMFKNSSYWAKVPLFAAFGLVTPIVEEIFYRGVVFSLLRRAFSLLWTLLISTSIFGLVHVYPLPFMVAVLMGFGLGLIRERRNSVVGPIVAHAIFNSFVLLISLIDISFKV